MRTRLINLLGGQWAYERFTLEDFVVEPGNRLAFQSALAFDSNRDNLYLWGPCGVGKTHLALALARRTATLGHRVVITTPPRLSRRIRMKDPDQEQAVIDELATVQMLVIDDLGMGPETPFFRQALQELFDRRAHAGRNGLVITSKYSLDGLAEKFTEDTIPSRIAGLCRVIHITGADRRSG